MIKYFSTLFFLFFLTASLSAQNTYEYMGFLQIQDSLFISYRLKFEESNGEINGFSVTDYGGEHETKSYIKGHYDKKERSLSFQEFGIEYTKSEVDTYDFCYVNYSGKVKRLEREDQFEGDFFGKYDDGSSCIDGKLIVKDISKMYKKAERFDKKIQRTKRIADSTKAKIGLAKMLDEKRLNVLKSNENTTVFWETEEVSLVIWDAGKEDGDKLSVRFNDKKLMTNYTISNQKRIIPLQLKKGKNTLEIKANNMGTIHPNTAKIELVQDNRTISLLTNLSTSETTTITLIKK